MPRTSVRGGPRTRARIAEVAAQLFLDRGFDAVTVAEVARAAEVSSVTVFNHFPRKEDLFLDRSADAIEFIEAAVRDRAPGVGILQSLRETATKLLLTAHPLSGVNERSAPFYRIVAAAPSLISRAREIAGELESQLRREIDDAGDFDGDAALFAAFFIAGYGSLMVESARRLIDGDPRSAVVDAHRARFDAFFDALERAFPAKT